MSALRPSRPSSRSSSYHKFAPPPKTKCQKQPPISASKSSFTSLKPPAKPSSSSSSSSSSTSCDSFASSLNQPSLSSTDPNYEWLHCNKDDPLTLAAAVKSSIVTPLQLFVATQCGHVLCLECSKTGNQKYSDISVICPVCEAETTEAPITNESGEIHPIFMGYFTPAHQSLETTLEATRFQQANLLHLVGNLKSKIGKHRQLLKKATKELVAYTELKQKCIQLEAENNKLRSQVQLFRQQHNPSAVNHDHFQHHSHRRQPSTTIPSTTSSPRKAEASPQRAYSFAFSASKKPLFPMPNIQLHKRSLY